MGLPIAAITTPPGISAAATIRISGNNAYRYLDPFLDKSIKDIVPYLLARRKIIDRDGKLLDACLISYMDPETSYTKEDVIDIHLHGNYILVEHILQMIIDQKGVRLSLPGEFSFRAFYNGKVDLSQAESLRDLIHSKTVAGAHHAALNYNKKLSMELLSLQNRMLNLLAYIEAHLDFSDEESGDIDLKHITESMQEIENKISPLIGSYEKGQYVGRAIDAVLVGDPNVGKSSIFNALLGKERSIVTDIAGTTRDIVSEEIYHKGICFNLKDSAGIRSSEDIIEIMGIEKTWESLHRRSIILYVIDDLSALIQKDWNRIDRMESLLTIVIYNKSDMHNASIQENKEVVEDLKKQNRLLEVSAKYHSGVDEILERMVEAIKIHQMDSELIISSLRHVQELSAAKEIILEIMEMLSTASLDGAAFLIREALNHIRAITGANIEEELINKVFSGFCIGK